MSKFAHDWDSLIFGKTPDSGELDGLLSIKDNGSHKVKVKHSKDLGSETTPRDGTHDDNEIKFKINHDDGFQRQYIGRVIEFSVPNLPINAIILGTYEKIKALADQETAANQKGKKKSRSKALTDDDGGWIATRPPSQ